MKVSCTICYYLIRFWYWVADTWGPHHVMSCTMCYYLIRFWYWVADTWRPHVWIHEGLMFGQQFETELVWKCINIAMVIRPVAQLTFTFIQLYFIFLNSKVSNGKDVISELNLITRLCDRLMLSFNSVYTILNSMTSQPPVGFFFKLWMERFLECIIYLTRRDPQGPCDDCESV